jgi:hypothetical protein
MQCSVVSLERATVSLVRWMERHHEQSTSIRALLLSPGSWDRWFPLLLPSAPTRCGGCHGVALRTGRYPTRRSVVAPRDEVKHPYAVACDARRLEGTHHHAGETAHACVAEASRSPSPSVSEADVWLSEAQRGCQARLAEGEPPRAARAPPPGIPLASVDLWPCATRFRALAHGPRRLCHPGPARRRLRAAALTSESGRVVRSSGPRCPLHRRPRLRHGSRRRGHASAASRPPTARARSVVAVGLSAQPPADRSVQRLIRRRRWTAPASRWAARRHSCPPGRGKSTPVDAAPLPLPPPPRGHSSRHRRRCALSVPSLPLAPNTPARGLCRSLTLLSVPGLRPPASSWERGGASAPP